MLLILSQHCTHTERQASLLLFGCRRVSRSALLCCMRALNWRCVVVLTRYYILSTEVYKLSTAHS
jgi:hypothetical protein